MKVAILTQPLHINYGGNLQAFALQAVLKKYGHEVETINYIWAEKNSLWVLMSFIKHFLISRKFVFSYTDNEMYNIAKEHKEFITKNIKLSTKIKNIDQLRKYFMENSFDAVIVGSDQVWRKDYSPRIESFFLDFLEDNLNIVKISYAASFGISKWDLSQDLTEKFHKLIKLFNFISVREDTAVELLKNNLDANSIEVLDPTLLLNEDDYKIFLNKKNDSPYIFSYILDHTERKEAVLNIIKNNLNIDILNILPLKNKKDKIFLTSNDYSNYTYKSVEDWLSGIKYSDFVVTDSFHGMVFSILFKKQFIVIANNERGVSRFTSLLSKLNLMNRLILDFNDINFKDIYDCPINYTVVNKKLEQERKKSLEFLMKSTSSK